MFCSRESEATSCTVCMLVQFNLSFKFIIIYGCFLLPREKTKGLFTQRSFFFFFFFVLVHTKISWTGSYFWQKVELSWKPVICIFLHKKAALGNIYPMVLLFQLLVNTTIMWTVSYFWGKRAQLRTCYFSLALHHAQDCFSDSLQVECQKHPSSKLHLSLCVQSMNE